MSQQPLSNEERLKIAAEVMDGKRPRSDMEKYGLGFGGKVTGDQAKQQLISELSALGAWHTEECANPDGDSHQNHALPLTVVPYATPPVARPLWVKLGLWGLPNRDSAWAFFWVCIVIAAGCAVLGFSDPTWFWGVGMTFAALWYWASIRWVDRNSTWR